MKKKMILSVGIVARNEEKFLPNLLNDILCQTYPLKYVELLLIDGMSDDSTWSIITSFKSNYQSSFFDVKILKNEKIIQASGWNEAIKNYTGDSLTRIDAHTRIDINFLRYVAEDLKIEKVVGGKRPCISEKKSAWSNCLLQVENSLFGSSILKSKFSNEKQYVKTMFHATYKREVIEKTGYFNEELLRTEDNEYHYRISKAGYKLYYDPRIISYQYAREKYWKMIEQKYRNGFWIGKTMKVCRKCISLYHLVPFVFVLGIILSTILLMFSIWQIATFMWGIYFLFAIVNTVFSGIRNRFTLFHVVMPFMFLTLHVSYGVGTFVGLFLKNG